MAPSLLYGDEKTLELVDKKINKTIKTNETDSKEMKKLTHMLIEFNIIPFTISFVIALSISDFIKIVNKYIAKKYFKFIKNEILKSFILLIIVLFFVYIIGYIIFYKLLYTESIAKENIVKNAIIEKEKDEIKTQIKKEGLFKN